MVKPIDWTKDPLVIIENAVIPVIWQMGQVTARLALGETLRPGDFQIFDSAADMFAERGPALLERAGAPLDKAERAQAAEAAAQIRETARSIEELVGLPDPFSAAMQLQLRLGQQLGQCINDTFDVFRRRFLSYVLSRQTAHEVQAKEAISGLDQISKQIFFISINASVEAARVGDAGKGFLQISTDIRALSHSAQTATRNLSDLVLTGQPLPSSAADMPPLK
ncbi:MAG: methyl-accepting chemotaxis protein [Sulfitobacter sp.]